MSRVLIPRGPTTSAKKVEASDFELYFSCHLDDRVICGFCLSVQCPNALAVDVASGNLRINGLHLNNTTTCSVSCLTACNCNFIYAQVCRDACCEPDSWSFSTNTTGCAPCDSFLLGVATTDCATVTAIDTRFVAMPSSKTNLIYRDTSLPSVWPTDRLFWQSSCGIAFQNFGTETCPHFIPIQTSTLYGDGSDCCATNPSLTATSENILVRNYTCLTIDCCTTWGGTGTIIVKVSGTLDITSTLNLNVDAEGSPGGGGVGGGGSGGSGGDSRGIVVIMAKKITGTGTITSTGDNGSNGSNGVCSASCTAGTAGCDGSPVTKWDLYQVSATGGEGGAGVSSANRGVSGGTCFATLGSIPKLLGAIPYLISGNPSGGGSGSSTGCCSGGGGGAGGASTSNFIVPGPGQGNGGQGSSPPFFVNACNGGGGGGGGNSAFLMIITNSISAVNITLTGGDGGNGGNGGNTNGEGGGGGGGGNVAFILVADADNTNDTLTAGSGGTGGSGVGLGSSGSAGDDGATRKIFMTTANFVRYFTNIFM